MSGAIDIARWRAEFAVTGRYAYFDHASVGPTPRRSVAAVTRSLEGQAARGSLDHPALHQLADDTRAEYAAFIGTAPERVAHASSTSAAISLVARGLDWRAGDEVLVPEIDFPSAVLPWKMLEAQGVAVRALPCADGRVDADALIAAIGDRTRVVCASWVQFSSGHRLDLARVGEACRAKGVFFVVDGAQGVGALLINVSALPVDALVTHGYKWLLGPQGVGWLYLNERLSAALRPSVAGIRGMTPRESYFDHTYAPRADAARFETGILNFHGIAGARASLGLLGEVGIDAIETRLSTLTARLAERLLAAGCEVKGGADRTAFRSGIVVMRPPGGDAAGCQARLLEAGFVTSLREGWVRISPHFYNTEDEIDRMAAFARNG
jgi:selenocysteine lyase/cysteine desulfurase